MTLNKDHQTKTDIADYIFILSYENRIVLWNMSDVGEEKKRWAILSSMCYPIHKMWWANYFFAEGVQDICLIDEVMDSKIF